MEGIQKVKMSSHTILTMGANANQRTMSILYGDRIAKTIGIKRSIFPGMNYILLRAITSWIGCRL